MFLITTWLLALLGLNIRPDSPPTEGPVRWTCNGLNVRDGSVICSDVGHQKVCQVECDGENQGEFTCTEDEGWSPKLPTCAKPIEGMDGDDGEVLVAAQRHCNRDDCNRSCHPRKGHCSRRHGRCTCH